MGVTRKILVAHEGEIAPGRTKSFRFGMANGIAIHQEGTLRAYVNRCTHMGGPVESVQKKGETIFRCRWHQAEFHPKTGEAIEGEAPPGTRLTPIELIKENDEWYAMLILPDDLFSF